MSQRKALGAGDPSPASAVLGEAAGSGRGKSQKPDPIDEFIGARLRQRRRALRISMLDLSVSVGVTFQQIQKYELGTNRVSAAMLFKISKVLETPVAWFFGMDPAKDIPASGEAGAWRGLPTNEAEILALWRQVPADRRSIFLQLLEVAGCAPGGH
jgi:transcriptional regulator with XRE-family HTH domain